MHLMSNASAQPFRSLPSVDRGARRSSGTQAADYIRELILTGHLRPGDRVPQDDIASALSLSRIPVREGLIALERDGWVSIELNRGAFVNVLDADAVRDTYELFGIIYGFAASRAIQRTTGPAYDELIAELDQILEAIRTSDDASAMETNVLRFHSAIVTAARSPRTRLLLRSSSGLLSGNFFAEVPGSIEVERRGSERILDAMKAGDADTASDGYVEMMHEQGELVVKVFEARGLFSPR